MIAAADSPGSTLHLSGVRKDYAVHGEQRPVLRNIDLDVAAGEFVSILGPSGCGKSTLLRLVAGLDQDFDGEIRCDGTPIYGPGLDRAMVFQDHRLFPWLTLGQNIALALKRRQLTRAEVELRVASYLRLVRLEGYRDAYPRHLSGGMAQRGALARAMVNHPRLLLLDEPLGALDALTRLEMQVELQRIWSEQRCTVLLVTHDIEEALFLGNRVVVMGADPGHIRQVVNVGELFPRRRDTAGFHMQKDRLLAELTRPQEPSQPSSPAVAARPARWGSC